jgi:hypothetical protein
MVIPIDSHLSDNIKWTQTLWRFPQNFTMVIESLCDGHGCAPNGEPEHLQLLEWSKK